MAVQFTPWPPAAVLQQNQVNLLKRLRGQIAAYEQRYELPSARLAAELKAGHIRDTAEVCAWFIAYETYRALANEQ